MGKNLGIPFPCSISLFPFASKFLCAFEPNWQVLRLSKRLREDTAKKKKEEHVLREQIK